MSRKALIIECSAVTGQDRLPGAAVDAAEWKDYLWLPRGGAWEGLEIEELHNPTRDKVLARISAMNANYGFITFSGHGYATGNTTWLCLEGGVISDKEIIARAPSKTTLVMDSCRGLVRERALAKAQITLEDYKARADYRRLFDDAVKKAELGACRLYGCDFDESAQESEAGGLFTQCIILAGRNWGGRGVLPLNQAFDAAARCVTQKDPRQMPQSNMGNRVNHFPFAVQV